MSISPDDLTDSGFTIGGRSSGAVTFLPEPERQPRKYTFISVDDHIVEPPDIFEGRLPRALQDRAPRVVEEPTGVSTGASKASNIRTSGLTRSLEGR